jgi:acyl-CoA thioesterase YciA
MALAGYPTLRVTMLPRDTNARGTIFGGVILSHIDLAGGIAAARRAARNFVTRACARSVHRAGVHQRCREFLYRGDARNTSITVQVSVEAGGPRTRHCA